MKNKNHIFFSLFFFFVIATSAQDKEQKIKLDFMSTTKAYFISPTYEIGVTPKVNVSIGILLGKSHLQQKKVFGVQSKMLYFPKGDNQTKLNLFLTSQFIYFYDKVSLNFSKTKTHSFQITFGYGANYHLSKKIYITTDMGLGAALMRRYFSFQSNNPSVIFNFAGVFSLGLNYSL